MEDPETPEDPFDHHAELLDWIEKSPTIRGPKLTFAETCGLVWALNTTIEQGRVSSDLVAKAYGLSPSTVSQLRHALSPDRKHYRDVHREFRFMGETAFHRKYYTPELHQRLKRIRTEAMDLTQGLPDAKPEGDPFAPRETASKYAFKQRLSDPGLFMQDGVILADGSYWRIDFSERHGWFFRECTPEGQKPEEGDPRIFGADLCQDETYRPFLTSHAAYDGLWEYLQLDNPRPQPGWNAADG